MGVAGYNLAEVGRMIEIAREAIKFFDILFISYGGKYEKLITEEGFQLKKMEPRLTPQKLAYLRKALSGETLNTIGYLNQKELETRVPIEIELFTQIQPTAVLTGWCLSLTLSTRIAKIPFINVLHSTSIREYYEAGLQSWPDRSSLSIIERFFSQESLNKFTSKLVLNMSLPIKAFNKVGNHYKLNKFKNFIDLIEGDYTLLADIPEWVEFESTRPKCHYIGPLPLRLKGDLPKEIQEMPRDRPIVYFAMGSSGKPELIGQLIESFKNKPYRVIAPVADHITNLTVKIPENVFVTGFLPAHLANPLADISVIHGGQNTVMNACLSGTPFVGVGMHPEQQANIDACVRKGFAIRINKKRLTVNTIQESVISLLTNRKAKENIKLFQMQLKKWDGPKEAATFLCSTFGGS